MTHRFPSFCIVALLVGSGVPAHAQIAMRPTPSPAATAENEAWYLRGDAITAGGRVYHPSGPVVHFHGHEMVLSGQIGNVPFYTRTTQEPGSIIYVPLPGGVVRPYERRRAGDIAGTVGSTAPSFPVVLPAAERPEDGPLRAAAPPTGTPVGLMGRPVSAEGPSAPADFPADPQVTGTSGVASLPGLRPSPGALLTARTPVGLNDVFVNFAGDRWFSAGRAVAHDEGLTRIGDHNGFPVYSRAGSPGTIYIPTIAAAQGGAPLLAPYRAR
jgi:hypothetical protein